MNDDTIEGIVTCNEILNHIDNSEEDDPIEWIFKETTCHEGLLSRTHPNYKGSPYNLVIAWENGEISTEPLSMVAADDPVSCAVHARHNNLLGQPEWKKFNSLVKK